MDLTTELLDKAAFREAKRGGYNTQDVDEFIEQVKVEYKRHAALLGEARHSLDPLKARLAAAEARAADASERADATSDPDDMLKRTLVLAQRTADAAIKEAEEQASRTLFAAQDQAARMLAEAQEATTHARAEAEAEARRAQKDARTRVLGELRDLEAARDQMHADVDTLERHLEEQRDRVRFTAHELQRLLDDPDSLQSRTVPTVSDVSLPVVVAPVTNPVPAEPAVEDPVAWAPDDEGWEELEPAADPPAPDARAVSPTVDDGPPTRPVELVAGRDSDDDAYLAELRKAMTDESPLGPREEGDIGPLFDSGSEPSRPRFGRRR